MTYVNPVYRHGFEAFLDEARERRRRRGHRARPPGRRGRRAGSTACARARRGRRPARGARDTSDDRLARIAEASTRLRLLRGDVRRDRRPGRARRDRPRARRAAPTAHRPPAPASASGVGTPEQAAEVGAFADGAIVGSALMAPARSTGDRGGLPRAGRGVSARPSPRASPSPRGRVRVSSGGRASLGLALGGGCGTQPPTSAGCNEKGGP